MKYNHTFHLVNYSPWPLSSSIGAMTLLTGITNMFYNNNYTLLMIGMLIMLMTMINWWRDITRESTYQGIHTNLIIKGLKLGMILFIISEIFLFISFFWSFFHSSLSPTLELGLTWPPMFILSFDPMKIPLLNSIILITSGISITWSHHALINKNLFQSINSLFLTITLGIYFTMLQTFEYFESPFNIANSIYGSSFFVATGFHGLHVIIGTLFLLICLIRQNNFHFSPNHHFGFEAAAWYWHFVDIVWLFLFISIYWWGS